MKKIKKYFFLMVLLLSACSTPIYYYSSSNTGENLSGKKVFILDVGDNVTNSKMENMLSEILSQNNIKAQMLSDVVNKKPKPKPDYVASAWIKKMSYQQARTVPVWGKTGISSINTTSYGNTSGNLYGNYDYTTKYGYNNAYTTGNLYGNYNTNSYTNTNTTVNYDYGITGYQNVIDTYYLTCSNVVIKKYAENRDYSIMKTVHESKICVDTYSNDDEFLAYVKDIYNQNLIFTDNKAQYTCEFNGYNGVCKQ